MLIYRSNYNNDVTRPTTGDEVLVMTLDCALRVSNTTISAPRYVQTNLLATGDWRGIMRDSGLGWRESTVTTMTTVLWAFGGNRRQSTMFCATSCVGRTTREQGQLFDAALYHCGQQNVAWSVVERRVYVVAGVVYVVVRNVVYTWGSLGSRVAVCEAVRPTFSESVPANKRNAVPAARAIASGARCKTNLTRNCRAILASHTHRVSTINNSYCFVLFYGNIV